MLPHIIRANYAAMRDKSSTKHFPSHLQKKEDRVSIKELIHISIVYPAPRAEIELIKCGCKKRLRKKA